MKSTTAAVLEDILFSLQECLPILVRMYGAQAESAPAVIRARAAIRRLPAGADVLESAQEATKKSVYAEGRRAEREAAIAYFEKTAQKTEDQSPLGKAHWCRAAAEALREGWHDGQKAPNWHRCDTHGPAVANAWGCPGCVRELREEAARLRAELDSLKKQAPIANVRVRGDGHAVGAVMYSPSLPAGDHDLYCEPPMPVSGAKEPGIVAYKFQSPNGSYWYISADDQRTIEYWRDKRKLIPLLDNEARIAAHGAVIELANGSEA